MASYERKYYEQAQIWERDFLTIPIERERITSTIELISSDVRTVLDVGCGNGAFLNSLPSIYQAVGLDFSQEALKYVKTKAVHGDIAALPFEPASFDLVTCLEVLEHLPYETFEKALSELQRVSKKYIIISVPNNEDLDYYLVICPACRCWYNPHRHVRSFDSAKLKTLFEHFALSELKELGPLEPRPQYNRFLYAAYRLWRNAPPPSTAVCPQCGHQSTEGQLSVATAKSDGLLPYALRLFKPFAKAIWRPQWRHRWLLALYVRKDLVEQP
ncbi:MAG: class I SAM-dependent methyltransferase [Desulfobacterota bacterium U4-17]